MTQTDFCFQGSSFFPSVLWGLAASPSCSPLCTAVCVMGWPCGETTSLYSHTYQAFKWGVLFFIFWNLLLPFFFLLVAPWGTQDFRSLTRDQTHVPLHWDCGILTTGPQGRSLKSVVFCAFQEPIKFCKMFGKLCSIVEGSVIEIQVFLLLLMNCVTLGKYFTFCKRDVINPLGVPHQTKWRSCLICESGVVCLTACSSSISCYCCHYVDFWHSFHTFMPSRWERLKISSVDFTQVLSSSV